MEGRIYVAEVAHSVGARVVNVYESLSAAGGTIFALFASDRQTTEQLVEALGKRPEVLAVSPNHEVRMMGKPKGSGAVSADKKAQEPKNHKVHAVEKPKGDGAVSADKKVQEPKSQAKKRKAPAKPKPKK